MTSVIVAVFAFMFLHEALGQSCVWTWVQPTGGTAVTKSVGAPATFTASVNDVLSNSDFLTWKSGTTDLTIDEYVSATSSFTSVVNPRSFVSSFEPQAGGTGNTYTLEFPTGGVLIGDDGGSITVTSQGCTTGGTSTPVTLSVRYCDLNISVSGASAADTSDCGFNCVRQFNCANPNCDSTNCGSFQATCQENATLSYTETCLVDCDRAPCTTVTASLGVMITSALLFVIHLVYSIALRFIDTVTDESSRIFRFLTSWLLAIELFLLIIVVTLVAIAINGNCCSNCCCCVGVEGGLCTPDGCNTALVTASLVITTLLGFIMICSLAATVVSHCKV